MPGFVRTFGSNLTKIEGEQKYYMKHERKRMKNEGKILAKLLRGVQFGRMELMQNRMGVEWRALELKFLADVMGKLKK